MIDFFHLDKLVIFIIFERMCTLCKLGGSSELTLTNIHELNSSITVSSIVFDTLKVDDLDASIVNKKSPLSESLSEFQKRALWLALKAIFKRIHKRFKLAYLGEAHHSCSSIYQLAYFEIKYYYLKWKSNLKQKARRKKKLGAITWKLKRLWRNTQITILNKNLSFGLNTDLTLTMRLRLFAEMVEAKQEEIINSKQIQEERLTKGQIYNLFRAIAKSEKVSFITLRKNAKDVEFLDFSINELYRGKKTSSNLQNEE